MISKEICICEKLKRVKGKKRSGFFFLLYNRGKKRKKEMIIVLKFKMMHSKIRISKDKKV
jgi:hypothetical protein